MPLKIIKQKIKKNNLDINIINNNLLKILIEDHNNTLCKLQGTFEEKNNQIEKKSEEFFEEIFNDSNKKMIKNQVIEDIDSIINEDIISPEIQQKLDSKPSVVDRRKRR